METKKICGVKHIRVQCRECRGFCWTKFGPRVDHKAYVCDGCGALSSADIRCMLLRRVK